MIYILVATWKRPIKRFTRHERFFFESSGNFYFAWICIIYLCLPLSLYLSVSPNPSLFSAPTPSEPNWAEAAGPQASRLNYLRTIILHDSQYQTNYQQVQSCNLHNLFDEQRCRSSFVVCRHKKHIDTDAYKDHRGWTLNLIISAQKLATHSNLPYYVCDTFVSALHGTAALEEAEFGCFETFLLKQFM